jgi:hypothetical protein
VIFIASSSFLFSGILAGGRVWAQLNMHENAIIHNLEIRVIFEPKRREVNGVWKKLHLESL